MKNILFILFLLSCLNNYAQSLKGKITGLQGEPVEYATIYIIETKTGCITSETGEFILSLESGKYTCIVQHMNYQTVTKTVEIPQATFLEIKMEKKTILLKEVAVSAKDEDRAYQIIRNTVAKSPWYKKQLLSYKATVYAKGTLKVKDAPKVMNLVNKFLKEENKIPIKKNDVFTEESVSEVTVTSTPDKVVQKVISKRTSYPEQFDVSFGFSFLNIYRTYDGSFISPVTKEGLSAYRYSLAHSYQDGENLIYNIKVTPKNNTPFTFSGTIDIIDGSWHVYNFELKGSMDLGFVKPKFTFKQNYVPIEKNVWMPGSFKTTIDAKAMGYHFEINTTHSIKYKEYTVNPALTSPNPPVEKATQTSEKKPAVSKKLEKLNNEITEIMNKEKFSTKEAIKLVELVETKNKEEAKNNPKNDSVNSLEIPRRFSISVDTNALKYDSLYWENYRTVPLTEDELSGFEQKRINDSIKEEKKKFSLKDGIDIGKKKDKTFFFGVSPTKSVLTFNTVEGFKAGIHLYANNKFKDSVTTLNNGMTIGYAFAAKQVFFDISSQWNYNPKRFASLELFGGKHTCDFKKEQQDGKYLMNSISSLFLRNNLIQYYARTFVGVKHKTELFHSFQMSCGLSYEQQRPLENRTHYSFFYRKTRDYKSNTPDNKYVINNFDYLSAQNALLFDISLSYTPQMFYRYSKDKKTKYYAGSKYPTFTLTWKKGINALHRCTSNFDYLELNIAQDVKLKLSKHLKYSVSAGFFPNTKNIHFSQFKHFPTNNFWVTFNTFSEAFNTMPNYKYSTNEWFVSGHLKYETLYLMLKFIPGLNKTLITENLHFSFLSNPLTKSYFEFGYSLSRIYFIGNIGFFVGFNEFKSFNWSVRVGFSLF
jgi:hypothetical protein